MARALASKATDQKSKTRGIAPQSSTKREIGCVGPDIASGGRSALTLKPAPAGHGLRIRRCDLPGKPSFALTPANLAFIKADLVLTKNDGSSSKPSAVADRLGGLIIAIAHTGINNLMIELTGQSVPFLDGSGKPFAFLMECAGINQSMRDVDVTHLDQVIVRKVKSSAKSKGNQAILAANNADAKALNDDAIIIKPAQTPTVTIDGMLHSADDLSALIQLEPRQAIEAGEWTKLSPYRSRLPNHEWLRLADNDAENVEAYLEADRHQRSLFFALASLFACRMMADITITDSDPALLLHGLQSALNTASSAQPA